MNDAQTRPRREYTPKPKPIFDFGDDNHSNGGYSTSMALPPSRNSGNDELQTQIFEYSLVSININL